jgi:hypothetical protein
MALHVPGADDDTALAAGIAQHANQWLASHLLLMVGWTLLAVGLASVSRLARGGRGSLLTAIGSCVGAVGALLLAVADVTHGVVAYALAGQVSPQRSTEIQNAYFHNPVVGVLMIAAMLLPLGVLVLGVGVVRSRVVPQWAGVTLTMSPLAIQVVGAAGPWEVLGAAPPVVGCWVLARAVADAGDPSVPPRG